MRAIKLTQGKEALVDDEDYESLSQFKWYTSAKQYAVRNAPAGRGKQKTVWMHREVLGVAPGAQVDHVDGNPLNNCRSNLRVASITENRRNKARHRNNLTGYKGVQARGSKWIARITAGVRDIYLGRFASPEGAARAYDAAARQYHGAFARLNFP